MEKILTQNTELHMLGHLILEKFLHGSTIIIEVL